MLTVKVPPCISSSFSLPSRVLRARSSISRKARNILLIGTVDDRRQHGILRADGQNRLISRFTTILSTAQNEFMIG